MGKPDLTGATLITFALSNLNIAIGATGFGIQVTSGELGIAAIEPPTPASGTDGRYWIAVDGTNLAASLTIGSSITATVNSLSVQINRFGGSSTSGGTTVNATALDWADDLDLTASGTYGGQVNPGANLPTPANLAITYTAGLLAIGGNLATLNIFNLITGSAAFAISVSTVNIGGTVNLDGATVLTLALSNLQLTVGVGSFGLSITGGNVGIAAVSAPAPTAPATDHRSWIAVDATGLSASIAFGTAVTASVASLSIQINNASGSSSVSGAASALNWHDDFSPAINPGSGLPGSVDLTIAFTQSLEQVSGTLTSLNIFNLITGSASFSVGVTAINLNLGDGTPDLSNATLVTVALSNLSLQIGVGGYGMTLTGGTLGLAAITPGPIPSGTTGASDNRLWVAVDGSIQTATLNLGPNITASAINVTVEINQASGAYTRSGTSIAATALNWTQLGTTVDPGQDLPTPVAMPIRFATSLIQVQATITLAIESFVYITGSVSFTKTGPIFVTPAGGGTAISVNALEIGASNVNAFFGVGGPYWITNPDGTISAPTAVQSAGALGLVLSNLGLGLAFLTPTSGTGTSFYALKAAGSCRSWGCPA